MRLWKNKEVLANALAIAAMPPLWAVLAPHFGITTGAVALICAGLFAASGNRYEDAPRICAGFLLGDVWAVFALAVMELLPFCADVKLYITLFVLGGLAVLAGSAAQKAVYLPSWLCGWAIGLTIMAPVGIGSLGTLPIEIGVSMIIGVIYVGIGADLFHKKLTNKWEDKKKIL